MTVVLTRSRVDNLVDAGQVLEILREGFRAPAAHQPPLRIRTDLPGPGTATCLMPGLLPGVPAYTVKTNAKFPGATPALRGVVCLHDLQSGELLALADSSSITSWRTGLAAALGTHLLAASGADTLGFVGAGAQAGRTLTGLRHLRKWRRVVACDLDRTRAAALTRHVVASAADVAADADVVVLATWSRQPLLHASGVRPGQHLTTLGADEPGKIELSADLLRTARVVVDDLALAAHSGALGNAGLDAGAAVGTLAEVVQGTLLARDSEETVTVYAPVGLPWQDLALTWALYQRATTPDQIIIDLLA
ncbi:ornithine cyclodeaminase family protein [Micromonospora sp. ATCC 39149]|uniref:Ornithine cyclodeaminase family protein n=1 Tax=Micromonospora carbonacea TaxID=47853 RepID=A0A7D6CF05_9ACTN|nr:ornithine cyclodeaminase family protein [Micromonospora sp. ATCC 39149]QLJ98428.1 ornithine cyclodeaminase family protein [Micromonospora carbonacea]